MIHLVHGFNVRDRGANSVGQIKQHLDAVGLDHRTLSYPWTRLLTLSTNNRWAVEELCDRVQPGDGFIGHSNGCWIGVQAAEMAAPLGWMILVNPALHPQHEIPGQVQEVCVYHSLGDVAVRAGKWWRRATRVLPWRWTSRHPWGAMGALGYTGNDRRVINVKMPREFGHSGVWRETEWLEGIAVQAGELQGGVKSEADEQEKRGSFPTSDARPRGRGLAESG